MAGLLSKSDTLPETWEVRRLDEVSTIIDSLHKTPAYTSSGLPMVRVTDVKGGFLDLSKALYVTEDVFAEFARRHAPKRGDIVFSRVGTYGNASYVNTQSPFCLGQNTAIISPKIDSRFLHYCLQSASVRSQIERTVVGSTQKTISLRSISSLLVPVPPDAELEAIAHILGTLDDKIELNRRMNETLEATARALFKSWFVDFDPVRAKAEGRDPGLAKPIADLFPDCFEDSELGEIPKGWRVGRLEDVLGDLISGARPRGGAVDCGVPSIGAENVIGLGRYDFSKEKFVPVGFFEQLKQKGADVRPGDVLLYKDGAQIGRKTYFDCNFPHAQCAINEHVFIVRAKQGQLQRFLFFWLDQEWMTHEIISLNSNSAQPGINQTGVRRLRVLIAHTGLIRAFDDLATPLTYRLFTNCQESRTLAALRDTLLPKLLSGEIRLSEGGRLCDAAL